MLAFAGLESVGLRPLTELEITDGRQLETRVVHGLFGLVDQHQVQHYVVRLHGDVRFRVHRVREPGQLCHSLETLCKVLLRVRTCGFVQGGVVIIVQIHHALVSRTATELTHRDEVVCLAIHLELVRLRSVRSFGSKAFGQHGRKCLAAIGQAEPVELLGRIGEDLQVDGDALLRVCVDLRHALPRVPELQEASQDQDHIRSHQICCLRGHVRTRAKRELRQRRCDNGCEEKVARAQQPPQLASILGSCWGSHSRRLMAIGTVCEDYRAPG